MYSVIIFLKWFYLFVCPSLSALCTTFYVILGVTPPCTPFFPLEPPSSSKCIIFLSVWKKQHRINCCLPRRHITPHTQQIDWGGLASLFLCRFVCLKCARSACCLAESSHSPSLAMMSCAMLTGSMISAEVGASNISSVQVTVTVEGGNVEGDLSVRPSSLFWDRGYLIDSIHL